MRRSAPGQVVTVLQSVRRPGAATNPYVVQLVSSLPVEVRASWFTWRRALLGPYDVLHLHWPDVLLAKPRRSGRLLARLRVACLLVRLAVLGTPVVRTAHNVAPHEQRGRVDRVLLTALDALTEHWIMLNAFTPAPEGRATLVLHGDYRSWFAGAAVVAPVQGRVLYFGLIRPYKGVPELLSAFAGVRSQAASLHVLGKPSSQVLEQEVSQAAARDARVTARLTHVDDGELATAVQQAQVVVLPYRELHNSGVLLLALSLNRPVLVPANVVTRALAEEVGPGWVHLYSGPLTAHVLEAALLATHRLPSTGPDLRRREWPELGRQHAEVYRRVLREVGSVEPSSGPSSSHSAS